MQAVREVAKLGCAVLCTIHQPSSELFRNSFDDLLLLGNGGRVLYFGELGSGASTLLSYLERNGAEPVPEGINPADYMLTATKAKPETDAEGGNSGKDWPTIWQSSAEKTKAEERLDELLVPQGDDITFDRVRATGFPTQFRVTLARAKAVYWRMTEYNWTRIVLSVVQGLLLGLIFLQPDNNQVGLTTRFSALFMGLIPAANQITNTVAPSLRLRPALAREVASGTYNRITYHLASTLIEIPYIIASTGLFSALLYFLVGFPAGEFGYYLLASILINMFGVFIGQAIAYAAPGPVAFMLAPVVLVVGNLLSGFLIVRNQFPVYLKWTLWCNPFAYYLSGISKAVYIGEEFVCTQDELIPFQLPTGEPYNYNSCADIPGFPQGQIGQLSNGQCSYCPVVQGDQLLDSFGVTTFSKWIDLAAVAGFVVVVRILGYLALRKTAKTQKV